MKSEDLLKAIGEIDDKFIEEAAPQINTANKSNTSESNDSAKTDDKKLVEVAKVKPRNTFRIVASIAACVCLVAAVSFAIIGSTKSRPQISDDGSCQSNEACVKENDDGISYLEDDENEKSYDKVNDNKEEIYNLKWSEKDNSQKYTEFSIDKYAYNSVNTETSSKYIGEKICDTTLTGTDDDDNKQESAGEVYKINNMSDKFVVAVKFKNDDKYYVYYATDYLHSKYTPKNLGEFIDDLSLEENLCMLEKDIEYDIYETNKDGEKKYKETKYYSISKSDIWNKLLYNRNIESLTDLSNGPYIQDGCYINAHCGYYMTIHGELPAIGFGQKIFRILIADEGYIVFRFGDFDGIAFKLSDEQIQKFLDLLGSEYNSNEISNSLESKYDSENSQNNTSSVEASNSESSNSAELSNTDIPDIYFCAVSEKITSSDVKAIKAGMTYKEIINQLGETANFGQSSIRQYIVDDKLVLSLRFDNLSDVCKKTGEELLKEAVPYKVPERIKDKLNDSVYAIVIDDKFISCVNGKPDNCYTLNLSDAEIKFENGKTATAADIKPMSSVLISYDVAAESYPGIMHCLKVTILDSNS